MAEQQQQISVQNQKTEEQRQLCNQMLTQMRHIGIKQGKNPMNPLNSDQNMIGDVDGVHEFVIVGDKESGIKKTDVREENPVKALLMFNPKIEFPHFDGTNPRGWVKKCSRYFALCKTPEQQKVDLASLYMSGKAESWYNGYILGRQNILWEDFVVDLCARFKDDLGSCVIEEFNKLKQTGTIDDYLEEFKELKSQMLIKNPTLPPDYFVASFVGGLDDNVKHFTRAFNPRTLPDAVHYARLQTATLQAIKTPDKPKSYIPQKTPAPQRSLLPTPIPNN